MNIGLIKRNACAALVDAGDCGYWVIARINGTRVRLHAGTDRERAERVFGWYGNDERKET